MGLQNDAEMKDEFIVTHSEINYTTYGSLRGVKTCSIQVESAGLTDDEFALQLLGKKVNIEVVDDVRNQDTEMIQEELLDSVTFILWAKSAGIFSILFSEKNYCGISDTYRILDINLVFPKRLVFLDEEKLKELISV